MTKDNKTTPVDNRASTFDTQFTELRRWPYIEDAVASTLDQRLIESRGRQFLYQSLSNGNLLAFVGSGVSVGYGRLSWDAWLDTQFEGIKKHADSFRAAATLFEGWLPKLENVLRVLQKDLRLQKSNDPNYAIDFPKADLFLSRLAADIDAQKHKLRLQRQRIDRLYSTFKSTQGSSGGIGGELPPIKFQIAEQLHDLLRLSRTSLDFSNLAEGVLNGLFEDFGKESGEQRAGKDVGEAAYQEQLKSRLVLQFTKGVDLGAKSVAFFDTAIGGHVKNIAGPGGPKFGPEYRNLCLQLEDYNSISSETTETRTFQENAKHLLIDEVAAAVKIVSDGFRVEKTEVLGEDATKDLPADNVLRRDFRLMRQISGKKRYEVLRFFRSEAVQEVARNVKDKAATKHWADIAQLVEIECEANKTAGRSFVSPTHRYALAMLAGQLKAADARNYFEEILASDKHKNDPFRLPDSRDYTNRRTIIDEPLDPLLKMVDKLGVRQFLTTNYDFEVERLFTDRGYLRFEDPLNLQDPDNLRMDGSGGRFADLSYRRERATDLLTFSLNHAEADAGVFHLHGRATTSSKLVITERDYMNLYLRDDAYRDTSDEAIRVAFSASPVLFVGLGMKEADVLRPLRQFMSDRSRDNQRWAFALLAAENDRATRESTAATLFIRYGVHAIYYGSCYIERPNEAADQPSGDTPNNHPAEFDWLHHVFKLCDYLSDLTKRRLEIIEALIKKQGDADMDVTVFEEIQKRGHRQSINPFLSDDKPAMAQEEMLRAMGEFEMTPDKGGSIAPDQGKFCVLRQLLLGKTVQPEGTQEAIDLEGRMAIWRSDLTGDYPLLKNPTGLGKEIGAPDPYTGFERKLLFQLVRMELELQSPLSKKSRDLIFPDDIFQLCYLALNAPEHLPVDDLNALACDLKSRREALNGVRSSLYTGAFSAALEQIEKDKTDWRSVWRASPPHRQSRFGTKAHGQAATIQVPLTYIRHEIDAVLTDLQRADAPLDPPFNHVPKSKMPDAAIEVGETSLPTGVRTFDDFIASLQSSPMAGRLGNDTKKLRESRRLFVIAARRGIGKGSIFQAFTTLSGLQQFMISSWPDKGRRPEYLSAFFVSLGFSTEIASNYDALIDAVIDAIAMLEIAEKIGLVAAQEQARTCLEDPDTGKLDFYDAKTRLIKQYRNLPRTDKLKVLLSKYREKAKEWAAKGTGQAPPRLLLAITAAELFFRPSQRTKNGEIRRFLETLFSEDLQTVPMDVVVVGNDKYISAPILVPEDQSEQQKDYNVALSYIPLVREDIDMEGLVALAQAEQDLKITFANGGTQPLDSGYTTLKKIELPTDKRPVCGVFIPRPMAVDVFLIDNFEVLASCMYLKFQATEQKDTVLKGRANKAIAMIPDPAGSRIIDLSDLSERELVAERGLEKTSFLKDLRRAVITTEYENADDNILQNLAGAKAKELIHEILLKRYRDKDNESAFREWRDIRRVLRGSRFCLTVLLAAAQRVAVTKNKVLEGAEAAEDYIRKTVDYASTVGRMAREQAVISRVIQSYDTVHDRALPQRNVELLQLILRHLAVIGTPTSLDVLVRAPDIRRYFDINHHGSTKPRTRELLEAATALVLRGLVFRIKPHSQLVRLARNKGADKPNDKRSAHLEYRYALHRMTQSHVLRKMGAAATEFGELNDFAPTLYASMPSQLPRLTFENYTFLQNLVSTYSQYPDAVQKRYPDIALLNGDTIEMNDHNGWVLHQADDATRVQALRAAMSIVRASFSVAVVSRFDDYARAEDDDRVSAHAGYFENYRVQIRWIIRKAWELLKAKDGAEFKLTTYSPDPENGFNQLHACYRDEIVWLYNECGVVSLVQGHVLNAVSLFRQALRINNHINQGRPHSPIRNRIALNLAVVHIERGRLDEARKELKTVRNSEDENGANRKEVWLLATGYLGLVDFLTGYHDKAHARFETAVQGLTKAHDLRACAVFSRHWGDLMSFQGKFAEARAKMQDSLGFAETGGHEDIHRKTQLALVKVNRANRIHDNGSSGPQRDDFSKIAKAQAYADAMEMPTLACEAKILRASLLIDQGETAMSGKLLIEAMSDASNNDLQLRLLRAMQGYAEVLMMRNDPLQAERVLRFAMTMAKKQRNRVAIESFERLLAQLQMPLG